jgi:hypothetical protein
MGRRLHGACRAAVFALCTVSIATTASAACWTQAEVAAAKVREMQTRLAVAARSCTAGGVDIVSSYDKFLATKRTALGAVDDRLRGHFLANESDEGARAYARYNAALELAYGAAAASGDSCAEAATLAREAASSRGDLIAVAGREVTVATLPSSVCPATAPVVLAAR